MHEVGEDSSLMKKAKEAFLDEAGTGLIKEYAEMEDELFSSAGFHAYAEDALGRMVNPFLRDPVDRVTRDPARKLGWEDRLLGSMKLARKAGGDPKGLAEAGRVALGLACEEKGWGNGLKPWMPCGRVFQSKSKRLFANGSFPPKNKFSRNPIPLLRF